MPKSNDDPSQRRYRRIEVRVGVRISTIDPETDPVTGRPYFRTSEETCANVSSGGAYVETHDAVSKGRRLLVELDLPDGERLQTIGRVAWTKTAIAQAGQDRTGMGIEFLSSGDDLQRLEAFLDDGVSDDPNASTNVKRPTPVESA